MSVATAMTDSAHQSVSGQKQGAKIEAGWVQLFSFLFNKNLFVEGSIDFSKSIFGR